MSSNHPRELIGKTISGATERDGGDWDPGGFTLFFTDGSSVVVEPVGYEVDGVRLELDSYTGRMVRGSKEAGEREQRRVELLTGEVRRREFAALRARMKAELSPSEFEQWLMERDPMYILKQAWGSGRLQDQFFAASPLLDLLDGADSGEQN